MPLSLPTTSLQASYISSPNVLPIHFQAIELRERVHGLTYLLTHTTITDTYALLDFNILLPTPSSGLDGYTDLLRLRSVVRGIPFLPPPMRFSYVVTIWHMCLCVLGCFLYLCSIPLRWQGWDAFFFPFSLIPSSPFVTLPYLPLVAAPVCLILLCLCVVVCFYVWSWTGCTRKWIFLLGDQKVFVYYILNFV